MQKQSQQQTQALQKANELAKKHSQQGEMPQQQPVTRQVSLKKTDQPAAVQPTQQQTTTVQQKALQALETENKLLKIELESLKTGKPAQG